MDVMGVVVRAKKPDWAQRMVDCVTGAESDDPFSTGYMLQASTATNLLRAHHRKVKRMVQNLKAAKHGLSAHTLDEVLAKLKELEQ